MVTKVKGSSQLRVADYTELRALTSSQLADGQTIPVTDDGIAGTFVVKTGTVSQIVGVREPFTDDSSRYAERVYDGKLDVSLAKNGSGEVSATSMSGIDSISGDKVVSSSFTYNGENISTIENFEVSNTATVSNSIYSGIVQKDAGVPWLHHNHLEEEYISTTQQAITSGDIPAPPIFEGQKQNHTNVLAYWYQDFGTESTRAAGGAQGWLGWYYWAWLFHGAAGDGYEAQRHPWLGYYRGDDANVLDWMCYWLNESGVTGVIPQTRGPVANFTGLTSTWSTPTDRNYWMYQLFNNAPNFKHLTYALWAWSAGGSPSDQPDIEASFDELISVYTQYDNFSYMEKNNKIYPVVFAFEAEQWRGAYDSFSGETNTRAFLIAQAAKFQAEGWDGFCLLARNRTSTLVGDPDLEANGVIYLDAQYADTNYTPSLNGGVDPAVDFEDLAIGVGVTEVGASFSAEYSVPNVATARESHSAHPSTWAWTGSTPALFEKMVRNALRRGAQAKCPNMLTIYNVSEWAEGGPALQPNMRDGKGYLDALRNALAQHPVNITAPPLYKRQAVQFLSASTVQIQVEENSTTLPFTVSTGWTHNSTSGLFDDPLKFDGKRVRIILDQSSISGGPTVFSDIGTDPNSDLRLTAATISLQRNDSVEFEYDATQDVWIQISPVINIL